MLRIVTEPTVSKGGRRSAWTSMLPILATAFVAEGLALLTNLVTSGASWWIAVAIVFLTLLLGVLQIVVAAGTNSADSGVDPGGPHRGMAGVRAGAEHVRQIVVMLLVAIGKTGTYLLKLVNWLIRVSRATRQGRRRPALPPFPRLSRARAAQRGAATLVGVLAAIQLLTMLPNWWGGTASPPRFADGFDGPSNRTIWRTSAPSGGSAVVHSGSMILISTNTQQVMVSPAVPALEEAAVTVVATARMRAGGAGAYSILCRMSGPSVHRNYYSFTVRADGYIRIAKQLNGKGTALTPWTAPPGVSPGGTNLVGGTCRTSDTGTVHLSMTLNGRQILSTEDTDTDDRGNLLLGGSAGLLVQASTRANLAVEFDDFTIY
jgi:hypothetical protein